MLATELRFQDRLLVVDDEESVAITVSEVLRREGFHVETALSGDEALERLQTRPYDLVLTDLHMEGLDGISVLSELHRNHPLTIAIVLTGFASLESAVASMRQGAYDYLIKPCIIEDLKLTIKRGLEHRRLLLAEQEARMQLEDLNTQLEEKVAEQTERLRIANDELVRANTAKDIFLATLSHELRTPLTPIIGWARVLLKDPKSPLLPQGLKAIERNALQQARLVEDLLDISRIITGKLAFEAGPVDLNRVAEAAIDTMRETAKEKRVALRLELFPSGVVVQGSASRLQQVVWNLISNAVKFTDAGGRVDVRVMREGEAGRIVVSDTGVGIAPDFLPHVFEMFKQGEGFHTRKYEGLGLGLSIVQRLVDMHGGRVFVESAGLGEGATFSVSIPVVAVEQAAPATVIVREEPAAPPLPGPIVVVDNSVDTLEILEIALGQKGWTVITAESVPQAVKILEQWRPSIVITDIGLPEVSGLALVDHLRLLGYSDVPLVALSGHARSEDREQALQAGFTEYLVKPPDLDKLILVIERLTAHRAKGTHS